MERKFLSTSLVNSFGVTKQHVQQSIVSLRKFVQILNILVPMCYVDVGVAWVNAHAWFILWAILPPFTLHLWSEIIIGCSDFLPRFQYFPVLFNFLFISKMPQLDRTDLFEWWYLITERLQFHTIILHEQCLKGRVKMSAVHNSCSWCYLPEESISFDYSHVADYFSKWLFYLWPRSRIITSQMSLYVSNRDAWYDMNDEHISSVIKTILIPIQYVSKPWSMETRLFCSEIYDENVWSTNTLLDSIVTSCSALRTKWYKMNATHLKWGVHCHLDDDLLPMRDNQSMHLNRCNLLPERIYIDLSFDVAEFQS